MLPISNIVLLAVLAAPPGTIEYNRQVRSILSNNCFKCHGPDAHERKAGLRLDSRDDALKPAKSGKPAITPGKPDESVLIRRIFSDDPSFKMPPVDSQKKLTDVEKETLRLWVVAGAPYQKHWAFEPIRAHEPPPASDDSWPRNAVDRFILARLDAEGVKPSPEASRETLIRRASLDLTGLPPTIAEIDAFLADTAPDAYEKVVDRLLASPRYGERMALEWLDAARYADTHGYHIDSGRDMTLWREWVIRAFNQDLPFDRFTIEQLAGDLLPDATLEQKVASGFHRNHMINFEGGAIPEEYHNAYIVDRVNTTGTVWLGLTVNCTQCHDHKFDPMTQREFYQLYAFFHNVPENGLDGGRGNAAPLLKVPTEDQKRTLDGIASQLAALDEKRTRLLPEVDAAQAKWEASATAGERTRWTVLDPERLLSSGGATLTKLDDGSVLAGGKRPQNDVYEIAARTDAARITAVRLEALLHPSLPGGGPGRADNSNFVLSGVEVEARSVAGPTRSEKVNLAAAQADYSQKGFEVPRAIDADGGTGWAVDGPTRREPSTAVFIASKPFGFEGGTEVVVRLRHESGFGGHEIGRTRIAVTSDVAPGLDQLPAKVRDALAVPAASRSEAQKRELAEHFRKSFSPQLQAIEKEREGVQRARDEAEKKVRTTMVMDEMSKPRETFILVRGQYDRRSDRVEAGVPSFLPPLPPDAPRNRLGLARWLVDPANPLTARVIVNRYWQMLFGVGIVKTAEDFGSQGEPPSHPELLDWLAARFVSGGWDVKAMVRLLATSAAYRQSSAVTAALHERDPENRLLARGPRFRLQAEVIRDQALAAGGLLDPRIGGPSVSPYQPPGLWEELMSREDGANWTAQTYVQSHGADLYRRTMYTFWKRTSPPPTLSTFDAPDRETCTVRRARTNTPLQALILMNDPTYVEAARMLAERMMKEAGPRPEDKVAFAFRLLTARRPSQGEEEVLRGVFEEEVQRFRGDPAAARSLLLVGESPRDESLDATDLAAWAMTASAILNLDETVTKG